MRRKHLLTFARIMAYDISLYDMCYSTLLHFDMEQWDEKITDCINYLILLKALVKEEQAYGSH